MVSNNFNVLLVEDNLSDIILIKTMLSESKEKFDLKFAETLGEALQILDNEDFDVMLLDLGLPDSQGFKTFTKILNEIPGLPIIIITGLEDETLGVKAVKIGAQDFLIKGQMDSKLLSRSLKYAIERKQTEEGLKSSLDQKDTLLKETHHRVKNNMQVIISLLNLQSHYSTNTEAVKVLKESQNRVKLMGMIHEQLYQSKDLSKINFSDYVDSLVNDLLESYDVKGRILPKVTIDDIRLNIETAVPCGLIISELVSNSLKYAFPDDRNGEVTVSLKSLGKRYVLVVEDDGIGIPEAIDYKNSESLGLQLVNNLSEQLDGVVEIENANGTKFKITFKDL